MGGFNLGSAIAAVALVAVVLVAAEWITPDTPVFEPLWDALTLPFKT